MVQLYSMQLAGDSNSDEYKKGIRFLLSNQPAQLGEMYYSPFFDAQAVAFESGAEARNWHRAKIEKLLSEQNPDGSWTASNLGGPASEDSHTMNTAWAILMRDRYPE